MEFIIKEQYDKKRHRTVNVLYLMERNIKLAKIQINNDNEETMNLSGWKAYKKGYGYGKLIIEYLLKTHPNLGMIVTDGFTKLGQENFMKVVRPHGFVLTELRWSGAGGYAVMWKQHIIDYYIDRYKRGIRDMFYFNPKLHSK